MIKDGDFNFLPNLHRAVIGCMVKARRRILPSPLSSDPPIPRWSEGEIVDVLPHDGDDGLLVVDFNGQIDLCDRDDVTSAQPSRHWSR
ncbi:MAG TPA: hypothetical protein VM165_18085 [Planctomycetaceae bacterium]|nr:hypothetical protein [Planctomycetaceae bacterium]